MSKRKLNVILLGIVSFLNDISSEMIAPILPLFITSLGGTGAIVGLIGGARDSIVSLLKVASGYISDKVGKKKPFVFAGYFFSAIFKFLLSFSKAWSHIFIFTSFERVGKGLRTAPRDALIAESMPKRKGTGFGIHRAMDSFGAVIGSVIVLLLFWLLGVGFKGVILLASAIAFFSLMPLKFVREVPVKKQKVSFKKIPKKLWFFILVAGVFALANFSYMFFILKAQSAFLGKWAVIIPLMLYVLFNIFYASFSIPFGILSDKIGRKAVLTAGYILFSLTALFFSLFESTAAFIALFALYGIVYAIIDSNQRAFVADLSPKNLKATSLGAFHTVMGLVALPSSLIAGFLWDFSKSATFIYGSAVGLIAVVLMAVLWKKMK